MVQWHKGNRPLWLEMISHMCNSFQTGTNGSPKAWRGQYLYTWPRLSTRWEALDSVHSYLYKFKWACDQSWLTRRACTPLCLSLGTSMRKRKLIAQVDASLRVGLTLWVVEKLIQAAWPLTKWLSCWVNQPWSPPYSRFPVRGIINGLIV